MIKQIIKKEDGAVLIEFAFIAPVLFLIMTAIFDFGYSIYARTVLNGAIQEAARDSALEDGASMLGGIDQQLRNRIGDVVPFGNIDIDRKSYFGFFDVERAEVFTDSDGNGTCNNNEPFTDENGNGLWDIDVGASGIGGPRDVVLYEITLTYDRIFPLHRMLGSSPVQTMQATTVLRNQPYGQQSIAAPTVDLTCP